MAHEKEALTYVDKMEKMIEDAGNGDDEDDQAADDAADDCENAEEELKQVMKQAEEDHKEVESIKKEVDIHHDSAKNEAGEVSKAYEAAKVKYEDAKAEAGNLSALEAIYDETIKIEAKAVENLEYAVYWAKMVSETKASMEKLVSLIASEIDGAMQLKKVAEDAYNTAAQYQDTTAQKEAYARAKAAYLAAKEHLVKIEGFYKDAVDMMNIADKMEKEATEFAE